MADNLVEAIEAQGFDDVPTEAIKVLVDMIRGVTPFNMIVAIDSALEVAKWALALFGDADDGGNFQATAQKDSAALADCLAQLLPSDDVSVQALDFPKAVFVEMLLKWLFAWLNDKMNN